MRNKTITHPGAVKSPFSSIEEIIADIRDGKMVIMVDDEDRENEGDLLMAAEMVRPEDINYMAHNGRGLICLTMTRERCAQLRLPLMVDATDQRHATNFTVSIEAAEGITTGISAHDRAQDRARGSRCQCKAGRPESARPHLPRHGAAGRRFDARRAHGSGLRPGAPRGS